MALALHLKMVKMVNVMLCIFYYQKIIVEGLEKGSEDASSEVFVTKGSEPY